MNHLKILTGAIGMAIVMTFTSCRDCASCKVQDEDGQVTKLYSERCGTSEDLKAMEDDCVELASQDDGSQCACEN
ncbi:MAG: hypothetical protein WD077_03085 [Bacteroidia bacterium]